MNIMHLKYAVEVAAAGSINKAAETLLMGQPNLSRAIKDLETNLGVQIFERSTRGISVTPEGEQFLSYARRILKQIDEVESIYRAGVPQKQVFSISVPRASYIAEAFAQFSRSLEGEAIEFIYHETNSCRAVTNILQSDYRLGILRYAIHYDRYFKEMLDEKGLVYEMVSEFRHVVLTSKYSALAQKKELRYVDLKPMIEIAHADPYVPSLPLAEVKRDELSNDIMRRIFVFDRASQFDLLASNHETFMWVSPIPEKLLQRFELVQIPCTDNDKIYKDVLIYRKDYKLTSLDKRFITELTESKRRNLR